MKQTTVDLTVENTPKPAPVGIVLTAALQNGITSDDKADRPEFGVNDGGTIVANTKTGYGLFLRHAQSITRVANLSRYTRMGEFGQDVIIVDGVLFLGRWNDGVVVK